MPALEDLGLVNMEAHHQNASGKREIGQGEAGEGRGDNRIPRKHAIGQLEDGEHHPKDEEQDVERAFRQPKVWVRPGSDPGRHPTPEGPALRASVNRG